MRLALCWDIDGTLLTTARAGILAWEEATAEEVGRSVDFTTLVTAGLTDLQIAAQILVRFGLDPTPASVDRLARRYEARLPAKLPSRVGEVLPGVREVLDALRDRPEVLSILLTGNTEAGGRAKLRHYGLGHYFEHGAFADDAQDRAAIARRARALVAQLCGEELPGARIYVIGDTPHDIHCAREIGARAVAVASGTYTADALRAHQPWWVVDRLPAPEVFLTRLSEDHRR